MDQFSKAITLTSDAHSRILSAVERRATWTVFRLGLPYVTAQDEAAARLFCGKQLGRLYTIAPTYPPPASVLDSGPA